MRDPPGSRHGSGRAARRPARGRRPCAAGRRRRPHLRRAGEAGDARQLQVVDRRDVAIARGRHLVGQVASGGRRRRRRPCASMMASICASARPDSRMSRAMRQPSPPRTSGSNSITRPGQAQRLLAQVGRRRRVVAQHAHHVARLQHRADAVADRLAAVGDHHVELQTQVAWPRTRRACADAARPASSAPWRVGPTGMSSTRWVEPAAIFFDRIDATICPGESMPRGRSTEIRMSSAGDSPAVPPQARQPLVARTICCEPLERNLHLGQHLHRVGGAGRRRDRARARLRAQHAVGGHDGHDQHRRAVARDAADAVLVDHRPAAHQACCQSSRRPAAIMASVRGTALRRVRGRSRWWPRRTRPARSSNTAPARRRR
jgi:hypothetical protein